VIEVTDDGYSLCDSDTVVTTGLLGTEDSLAYRVHEIERHLHHYERWFGAAGAPSGETHVADRIGTTSASFQADAGNDTWGTWLQVLGSSDTPADAAQAKYDFHRVMITAVENANSVHFIQIALGTSGAAALAAGDYTEFVFQPQSVQGQQTIVTFNIRRCDDGTKAWVRAWVVGANTSTVNFFVGIHEYPG
jgi:hypothetical protein